MSFVERLEYVSGMIFTDTHLKGLLGFGGVFDIGFLFIVEIWHDVKKGSGYILNSISCQTFAVSTSSSDFVDLFPNIWLNYYKETFFLGICICDFDFSFIFYQKCMFYMCAVR